MSKKERIVANDEQKKFAKEIANNICAKHRDRTFDVYSMMESVRQMVAHKLAKEGWRTKTSEPDIFAQIAEEYPDGPIGIPDLIQELRH